MKYYSSLLLGQSSLSVFVYVMLTLTHGVTFLILVMGVLVCRFVCIRVSMMWMWCGWCVWCGWCRYGVGIDTIPTIVVVLSGWWC